MIAHMDIKKRGVNFRRMQTFIIEKVDEYYTKTKLGQNKVRVTRKTLSKEHHRGRSLMHVD